MACRPSERGSRLQRAGAAAPGACWMALTRVQARAPGAGVSHRCVHRCGHSLRCKLDANLLGAIRTVVRHPAPAATPGGRPIEARHGRHPARRRGGAFLLGCSRAAAESQSLGLVHGHAGETDGVLEAARVSLLARWRARSLLAAPGSNLGAALGAGPLRLPSACGMFWPAQELRRRRDLPPGRPGGER